MFRRLQPLGGAVFLLAACAAPQQPPTATNVIAINSTPAGATASVSSGEWCVTPCTLTRPVAGTFTVRLQKDGFEPREVRVEPEMAGRAQSQLRRTRPDPELRRQPRQQAQEAMYAPVMAQLQPLPGNADAEIAALVYAQKVDPVMPQAVGSTDLNARAALGQQFGVRVAGYDQAPVEFTPVSRRPGDALDEEASTDTQPKSATGEPTGITASSFDRRPIEGSAVAEGDATGDLTGGSSSVVDIPLDGAETVQPDAPIASEGAAPAAESKVALLQPEPKDSSAPPPMEVAPDMGNAMVQLASFRDESMADQAVDRFQSQYADVLGTLIPDVQMADLGEKGIYYRVRFAGLATIEEARRICSGLSAGGQGCMAVKR